MILTTICFVAGHSGGHILPALTKAQQLKDQGSAHNILFFSTTSTLDSALVKDHPAITTLIQLPIENVPYKKLWRLPIFIIKYIASFFTSFYYLLTHKPERIISMGGFVSVPVCLAGVLLRIPIELYELNVEPGKTVKFLAPLASTVSIIYPETKTYLPRAAVAPYPLRFEGKEIISREQALKDLNFAEGKTTLFVMGGSQGSVSLNSLLEQLVEAAESEQKKELQIIHQTGSNDHKDWKAFYKQHHVPAYVFAYDNQIEKLYQAADIVLCRAGAGTLAELQFFKKRAIIVPLETSITSHQLHNAYAAQQSNPALFRVIRQRDVKKISLSVLLDQKI